jgi:radical SAM superfamily enzyme YgiQ (UPF0313 family)
MGLGIESGSDRILNIIGKNVTSSQILEQLFRLKRIGILPTVSIMVGQHTETSDDVESSIDLMRKSVRNNPNIQYAFTLTTPFPGSRLYELLFQEGHLKNHQDFFDKYFSTSSEWSQVVNLSNMSDKEVIKMYKMLVKAYHDEKSAALGVKVNYIRTMQKSFGFFDRLVTKSIFPITRKYSRLNKIEQFYNFSYHHILEKLDNYRLKLEGIQ